MVKLEFHDSTGVTVSQNHTFVTTTRYRQTSISDWEQQNLLKHGLQTSEEQSMNTTTINRRITLGGAIIMMLASMGCEGNAPAPGDGYVESEHLVDAGDEAGDDGGRTPEGFLRCDPASFVPKDTIFVPVLDSSGNESELTFFLQGGDQLNSIARINIYGARTECIDGVHQIAYYGDFETPLTATQRADSVAFSFDNNGSVVHLGTSSNGFSSCNPVDSGTCPLSVTLHGTTITFELHHQGTLLFTETHQLPAARWLQVVW
ncbi:hypothetical protein WMF30_43735 [Sorangium sp. So ce134]